jgi:hypothetical protein
MKKVLLFAFLIGGNLIAAKSFSQASCGLSPDFSDPNPTKMIDGGTPGGGYEPGDHYLYHNVLTTPES